MRLKPDQLATALQRQPLSPIYLISGDEPLQSGECADLIRKAARASGDTERIVFDAGVNLDWAVFAQEAQSLSLFSSRRIIEVRLGPQAPGQEGAKTLTTYSKHGGTDDVLIITTAKLDQKTQQTNWFKAIDAAGVVVQVWPIGPEALPNWLVRRARSQRIQLDPEAAQAIAERVEGNLLAASQELNQLSLLTEGGCIGLDHVLGAVSDSSRYDVFALTDCALSGNLARAIRILKGLRQEGIEPILINWALTRELRALTGFATRVQAGKSLEALLTEARVYDKRKPLLRAALKRCSRDTCYQLLLTAGRIDRIIKGASPGDAWDSLLELILALGAPSEALATH